jgi:ribonuclease VapC
MKRTVLDSYAVITYLERQQGYENVSAVFKESVDKNREIYLSVINWGEVIYHALRTGGDLKAQGAIDVMAALPIEIVEADEELTLHTAQLKASHRMSYADCFAAALAMKKKCELVTGDKEFKQVEKEVKIRWI